MTQDVPSAQGKADLVLGRQFVSAQRFDLAEPRLRAALAAEPDNASAHALLSACLVARSAHRAATDEARESIRLAPTSAPGYAALASAAEGQSRWKAADEAIREAIRFNTVDTSYRATLSFVLLKQRKPRRALVVAEEGLALNPNSIGCLNSRALALVALGRISEARESIRSALIAGPQMAILHSNLAVVLLNDGEPGAARDESLEALRLDPTSPHAQRNLRASQRAMARPLFVPQVRVRVWWRRRPIWQRLGLVGAILAVGVATSTLLYVLIFSSPILLATAWDRAPEELRRQPFGTYVPRLVLWGPLAIVLVATFVSSPTAPSSRPVGAGVPRLPASGPGSLSDQQVQYCLFGGMAIDLPAAAAGIDMPDSRGELLDANPPPSDIADDPPGPDSDAWLTKLRLRARGNPDFMLGCAADLLPSESSSP